MSYAARSLDDVNGATTVVFHPGATPAGHFWEVRCQTGDPLARSTRIHRGGKFAQVFWKWWTVTGMGVGDDIHIELLGVDDVVLGCITSLNDKPAVVTVTDPAGTRVARSQRRRDVLTVYGSDDAPLAELTCEGDGPWPVRDTAGTELGELLAGEPGPSTALSKWVWVDPQYALNTATYARSMHLGLRRVKRYSYLPTTRPQPSTLGLLPLLCGLTY